MGICKEILQIDNIPIVIKKLIENYEKKSSQKQRILILHYVKMKINMMR